MTDEEFLALRAWVRAEAKLIAAEIAGHHERTIQKHRERVAETERRARRALQVAD